MVAHGGAPGDAVIAGVVLAAGLSSRMGRNKLLIAIDGRPLVARVADAALAAGLDPVVVVTGHDADRVRAALAGRAVTFVHNRDFAAGMATSLKAGIAALPAGAQAAVMFLGDMPDIEARHVAGLLAARHSARDILIPTHQGRRGHPVVFGRAHFAEILALGGDVGARAVIAAHADAVRTVEMDDAAILVDLDSAAALEAYRRGGAG